MKSKGRGDADGDVPRGFLSWGEVRVAASIVFPRQIIAVSVEGVCREEQRRRGGGPTPLSREGSVTVCSWCRAGNTRGEGAFVCSSYKSNASQSLLTV
ncbi:hypothetical protein E2C01_032133 [Portunus trituberculatus]|uniref:Uncharacterized protein n=1 Tax=Portunus trituberculatus TaxID=210409 RepID=A0A5B7EWQ4_PORTR|nr:hypothetical protein [Portunus trituberculatus]